MTKARPSILDRSFSELTADLEGLGQPRFRAAQVWQWVWNKGCRDFAAMSNLKKDLRLVLAERYSLDLPRLKTVNTSTDGTIKGLIELHDGCLVEWVLIPEKDHYTLCLSSQAGCRLGCTFCSTGRMGFERNLSAGEILSQILLARETLDQSGSELGLRNIVFMGMGEPLLNWQQVEKSLFAMRHPQGLAFSHRRVTVSTVGIPKTLEKFAHTGLASLAVSLHAPTQELREQIMPRAAGLIHVQDLANLLAGLPLKHRQRITIEYILLGNVNDGPDQARELNRLLARVKCKINLIAFNPAPELPYTAPSPQRVLAFERILWDKGRTVILRKSKGQDIQAACGQLRSQTQSAGRPPGRTGSDHAQTGF